MISRRSFLGQTAATTMLAAATKSSRALGKADASPRQGSSYVELFRVPDTVVAFQGIDDRLPLARSGNEFTARDVVVTINAQKAELRVRLSAPTTALTHVHLRWLVRIDPTLICLGDQWERSYGDLAWRGITPERVMPWYFAAYDGNVLNAYGVRTGAAAFCFWQVDPEGISLWLDVSNGGDGVVLGQRELDVATVVTRHGKDDESPLTALQSFCRSMCTSPRLPSGAVFGVNDWYYAYGNNNQQMLFGMADLVAELAPSGTVRPYAVVDMGWKDGSAAFPSMANFAAQIKSKGVRPGIWIRPLEAMSDANPKLLLPAERFGKRRDRYDALAFDPSIPEALALVTQKAGTPVNWGFEFIKHDFSTYDLLGQWGFEMGAQPTIPGWHLNDRSRTNAEVILGFYKALREVVGETIPILGCNTVGHLGAGVFELQRTGDDTSGKVWERTRRMGVNTLAYRLPQDGTFFRVDPDCASITAEVPWKLDRQWLDLVARSKTTLFVSPDLKLVQAEQRAALREAFAIVASNAAAARPADFFHDTTPEIWNVDGVLKRYEWCGSEGAYPFTV